MKSRSDISRSVISRMPRYYRFLKKINREGLDRISSAELARRMGLTASQVRQDFNLFGGFGQQGYGYNVRQLCAEIGKIIGVDRRNKLILVGAGNLGKAVSRHITFEDMGFTLIGIFDTDKKKIGDNINGCTVLDYAAISDFCSENKPDAAIIAVPDFAAEEVVKTLYACEVKSFWNFTHYDIDSDYSDVVVENVHLNDSLMTLCYNISNI